MHRNLRTLGSSVLLIGASLLALAARSPTGKEENKAASVAASADLPAANPENNVYFGVVHVHTAWSFDALINGTRATPMDAYAWAQGKAITGRGGPELKVVTPLDFYMVADHTELLGVFNNMDDPTTEIGQSELAKRMTSPDANTRMQAFNGLVRDIVAGTLDPMLTDTKHARTAWADIIKAADANYVPGKFTTFAGFEWSAAPVNRNLHRVVVFRDTANLPEMPLSSFDSEDPESLWKWMDLQRQQGASVFAIPHNGNVSDGRMFEMVKFNGKPIDAAYSKTRARNEPLYEITQQKGTSETHPDLSPTDEFAGFEQWDYLASMEVQRPTHRKGSFLRQALLDGMASENAGTGNPFKYGIMGDSDTHNAAASHEENNFTGKWAFENNAKTRLTGNPGAPAGQILMYNEFSSGGLTGVWAPQNTREAIWDAMQRKETFATTGPMMKVRFFGSFDYAPDLTKSAGFVKTAYAKGVPMGGDLKPGAAKAPTFLFMAVKDPKGANLDRLQIVKGWIDAAGKQHEKIYDVAWGGDRKIGANGKLPPVGNTVDVTTATYTNAIGEPQFIGSWTDPAFRAGERAFYYARVIQIPTPRWNTYDAARLKMPNLTSVPATIQERAWSSPIWYNPKR